MSAPCLLHLPGRGSSVVIEVRKDEAPLWRYWGPRLPADGLPGWPLRAARPPTPAALTFDQPLSLAPCFGVGWFGQSALLAHRDGRQFAQAFSVCNMTQIDAQCLRFDLYDPVAELRLTLALALDAEHDVLTLTSTLANEGDSPLQVQWLAAGTLPLPAASGRVRAFHGQWAGEFAAHDLPLGRSEWRRENRRGRTSHDNFPGAVVFTAGATEHDGTVFGAHLGHSGNHTQSIEWLADGSYQWQMGEWLAPGEVILAPGETVVSPTVYAACSVEGGSGLAQCFHAAARALLPWPAATMRPRPVHLNTWEAVYFDHREDDLRSLATAAAELGVERFVLDDGWFHGRHHDRAGLGDWWPDAGRYPQGLRPLAEHVKAQGMEFGLWVEPEMVNPDSELYRAHPDWALQLAGRPLLTARHQLVLDLSRAEVADYLFERVAQLLATTPIDYLKWDMNRDLTVAGHDERPAYRAQVAALYHLLDRLHAAYPRLEIESCASGGGRMDFGVLRHCHRFWLSDNHDALVRINAQRGALQFFPPEVLGAHIGAVPSHVTGRSQSLAFRAAVALPGHFGLELDPRQLGDDARIELRQWIALYRSLRDALHRGRVWQGEGDDGIVWQAHGEPRSLLLLIYRLQPAAQRWPAPLRLPMALREAHYRVQAIAPVPADAAAFIASIAAERPIPGAWLVEAGLPLPRLAAESCLILRLTANVP